MAVAPRRFILEITVFVCGALLMVFEIIGSRILSPFIGTSTYIWTSLIGVILASLSVGYWLGGKSADRKPDVKILALVIFLAGGCVSVTILSKEIVLSFIAASGMILEIKSLLAALMLFAPASVALGFVTPYAVRLRMVSVEDSGKTVGRLFAFSTIGSIVGTFAAGFFLIPFVGSIRTLYLIAGGLILLSMLLVPFALTRFNLTIVILFLFGVAASEFTIYSLRQTNGLYDIDTEYSRIQVFQTTDKAGKPVEALATDPYFVQSAMYLDSDDRVLEYSRFYHLLRHFKPGFQRTLMIGGAGFTFPREYLRTYPDTTIDVVEIDPQMVQIARHFFRLKDDPRMKIVNEDGRVFLNHAPAGGYDAVLMDAFGSLFSVPPQLTTVEAVQNISRVLNDDGVVIANLGSAIKGPGSLFLQAEVATYKQVFPNVYLFKVNTDYTDERLQNVILVASKSSQPIQMSSGDDIEINYLLSHRYNAEFPLMRKV
ncbi:MAG TPA: fused MFS/spermidine synthase, partial [Pyrinomonadaceae bacterium]|nr:fused MFS/spermidine synthase [Pyrinomonadaceae bacterium]